MLIRTLVTLILSLNVLFGATVYVAVSGDDVSGDGSSGNPYQTIPTAIVEAASGDTISIGAGSYTENITSGEKSLVFMGEDSSSTLILADDVTFTPSQTAVIVLKNLGFGSNHSMDDLMAEANCSACAPGDTLFVTLTGVAVHASEEKRFMEVGNQTQLEVRYSQFSQTFGESHAGAVFSLDDARFRSIHSHYLGNASNVAGQVVYASGESYVEIQFSTFSANGSLAGAIAISDGSDLNISNSILRGTPNFQIVILNEGSSCTAEIAYSDITNGQFGVEDQSGSLNLIWGSGNFNADPLFVSGSDLHLLESSPCIDAGNPDQDGDGSEWTFDLDDQDPDGTRLDIGAFWFDQTDSQPPQITSFGLVPGALYSDGEIMVQWTATDDKVLDWAKLDFSSDGGGSYTPQDSIAAEDGEALWALPSVHSDSCKLVLSISDGWGNITSDTTAGFFSIADTTHPQLTLLQPTQSTTVLEGENLTCQWEASDNVALSHTEIWVSTSPHNNFVKADSIEPELMTYALEMGSNPGDSARISIRVVDIAGNQRAINSEYFRILDNTPPTIEYIRLSHPPYAIGSPLDIDVDADDNVGVTSFDIAYTQDSGVTWSEIISDLEFVNTRVTHRWTVPDIPGVCQIRVIAYDAMAMSDTSMTDIFQIEIIYPQMILDTVITSPSRDSYLVFDQVMESDLGESSVRIEGTLGGLYDLELSYNLTSLTLHPVNGFIAEDTLQIVLDADQWYNTFGYGLDGNGNGSYEGSPTDNDTTTSYVVNAGDFRLNGGLDFEDFDYFVTGWNSDRSEFELAPHTGTIPHIRVQGDGIIDILDLATFAASWNWQVARQNSPPSTQNFDHKEIEFAQRGPVLEIETIGGGLRTSQLILTYDPVKVRLSLTDQALNRISSSTLSLLDDHPEQGYLVLTQSHDDGQPQIVSFDLESRTSAPYSIEVARQWVNSSGEHHSQRSAIELAPIPTTFKLAQNYPNPFNPSTNLSFACPSEGHVTIKVFNLLGQEVIRLLDKPVGAGYHQVVWHGGDDMNRPVPAGVYLVVMDAQQFRAVRKIMLLK